MKTKIINYNRKKIKVCIEDEEDVLEDKSFYCEECWEKHKIKLDD